MSWYPSSQKNKRFLLKITPGNNTRQSRSLPCWFWIYCFSRRLAMAAVVAVRALSATSNTLHGRGSAFFSASPSSLSFRHATGSRRSFHGRGGCKALHKVGQVQTKEEGLPETLDYRVFFLDDSSKKVLFFPLYFLLL